MPCRAKYNHTKPHNNIPHHTIHKHTNLDQQNRRALHKYSATKRQAGDRKAVQPKQSNARQRWQGEAGGPNHNAINQVFASHALHCRQVKHPSADVSECVKHFVLQVLPSPTREQVRDWRARDHPALILTVPNILQIFHLLAIFVFLTGPFSNNRQWLHHDYLKTQN